MYSFIYVFVFFFCFISQLQANYKIYDLGTLDTKYSVASSINENGQISGFYMTDNNEIYVFLWDQKSGLIPLNIPAHGPTFINNNSQIVGILGSFDSVTFFWDPVLGVNYFSSNYGLLNAFNDNDEIFTSNKNVIYIHKNDSVTNITGFCSKIAVNNNNKICGTPLIEGKPQYNTLRLFDYKTNEKTDIKFNQSISISDINNLNQVIGSVGHDGFIWESLHGPQLIVGFIPKIINDENQIIGIIYNDKRHCFDPYLWDKGVLKNLNDLLDLSHNITSTWERIEYLWDINNKGQMVGVAKINGASHAVLISPIN